MHNDIADLIGVTEQQFDLLRAIDAASAEGGAKPKSIEQAYRRLTSKFIQKPNLFAQLRDLQKLGFVVKSEGTYSVSKSKIKQGLQSQKLKLKEDINSCDTLSKNISDIFKSEPKEVKIKYLSEDELMQSNVENIKEAKLYLRTAHLPNITCSDMVLQLMRRDVYINTLKERCKSGGFKVQYIISMDPRRVFHRLSDKFKDKNLAYKEVVNCYENLIKLLKFPNLEFRYISAHLESFGVLESESLHVLTLPLRTSPHQLAGAIKIEDKKICDTYMDMFYNLYKIATPLTEALVRKIVKQKLKEIRSMMRAPNSD